MTHAAVAWTLDQLASVAANQPDDHPLHRVDRDTSQIYEGTGTVDMSTPPQDREGELQTANFVGASFVDRSGDPIGTEYDLDLESVVGIRIEGYSGSFGHIDPNGVDGVVFSELVEEIRSAVYDGREWPDTGATNVAFTHLAITNEAPQSDNWEEYFRTDMDILLSGFEELG